MLLGHMNTTKIVITTYALNYMNTDSGSIPLLFRQPGCGGHTAKGHGNGSKSMDEKTAINTCEALTELEWVV